MINRELQTGGHWPILFQDKNKISNRLSITRYAGRKLFLAQLQKAIG
jgi:hypothetical protein